MTHSIFIDGAAGTTGLEIRNRLRGRDEFDLIVLDDSSRKDGAARREALNECDIAILCLPDDAAREAVALVDPASGTRVIDASSAHRVEDGWCYGFPELIGRERVAEARRVSNPGCYPTGFLALVAPLVRTKILPADWAYTVHAVSGYSGGGNGLIERFENTDTTPAYRAYALGMGHKHLLEMQNYAELEHAPLFSPAVVDAFRGMIVEVPLPLTAMDLPLTSDTIRNSLTEFYAESELVIIDEMTVHPELLLSRDTEPHDGCELFVFGSEDDAQARLIARLDNLGKGASGAAVQNLNLMCGLEETTGLRFPSA